MNKLAPDGHAPSLSGHPPQAAQGASGEGRTNGKSGSDRPTGPACFQNVTWASVPLSTRASQATRSRSDEASRRNSERNLMFGSPSFNLRVVDAVLNLGLPAPIDIQVDGSDLEATHRTAVEIARDFRFSNRQVSREEPAGSSTTAYSIHFTPRNRCFTPKV